MAATSDHPPQRRAQQQNGKARHFRQQRPQLVRPPEQDETVETNEPALLPQNEDAERALLGAALIDRTVLARCAVVKPHYFFRHQHQVVWEAMQRLHDSGRDVDIITVADELATSGKLEDAGGSYGITSLSQFVPQSMHAESYARIVCEKFLARFTLRAAADLGAAGYRADSEEISRAWTLQHAEIQEVTAALALSGAGATPRFAFMTDEEVEALPDPEWLIHDLLVENTISVAFGDYGSGKSFLALDWALSIATGFPWMNHLVKRGLVAYIAGEGIGGMKRRMRAWKKHHHWTSGPTGVHLLGTAPQLLQPEDVQALLVSLRALPDTPVLVVIDTLSRSMSGGEENLQRDMSIAVAAAEIIRAEFGCHVLIVHHKPAGVSKTRGSTVLPGAAQTLIDVSKDGSVMTIDCPKQKDHKAFSQMKYRLHSVVLDEHDAQNNSLVLVPITAFDGDDEAHEPVKLTRAAENVREILQKSPGHAGQFMVIVNAMAAAPYRMSKSATANALNLLQDARLAENTGTFWRLLE